MLAALYSLRIRIRWLLPGYMGRFVGRVAALGVVRFVGRFVVRFVGRVRGPGSSLGGSQVHGQGSWAG